MMDKNVIRQEQSKALEAFFAKGGSVTEVKARKTPKGATANGKHKGGKVKFDPTLLAVARYTQ